MRAGESSQGASDSPQPRDIGAFCAPFLLRTHSRKIDKDLAIPLLPHSEKGFAFRDGIPLLGDDLATTPHYVNGVGWSRPASDFAVDGATQDGTQVAPDHYGRLVCDQSHQWR